MIYTSIQQIYELFKDDESGRMQAIRDFNDQQAAPKPAVGIKWKIDLTGQDLLNYINYTIITEEGGQYPSCSSIYGRETKVRVFSTSMEELAQGFVCIPKQYDYPETYIIVTAAGGIIINEGKKTGITDEIFRAVTMIVNSILSAVAVGSILGNKDVTDIFNDVAKYTSLAKSELSQYFGGTVKNYQKAAAWISRLTHYDLLKNLHSIGRVAMPKYNEYFREQELQLAQFSEKIFGNVSQLNSYVHIAEMIYTDLALRAGKSPDEARYEGLQHGADVIKKLGDKLDKYEREPALVWTDIMNWTFGEGNPYISAEARLEFQSQFAKIAKLGDDMTKVMNTLTKLGVYGEMFDEAGIPTVLGNFRLSISYLEDVYKDTVQPALRKIKEISDNQQLIIEEMQRQRLAEELSRKRAALMATPPNELSDQEKSEQSAQFTDLFIHNIMPSDTFVSAMRESLDKIFEVLYE